MDQAKFQIPVLYARESSAKHYSMISPFVLISALLIFFIDRHVNSLVVRPAQSAAITSSKTPPKKLQWVDRRSAAAALVLLPSFSASADTGAEVRGTSVNAFNGLIFNYRGNDFNGLHAKDIDEPSISYADFVTKLKDGGISSVEFYAPDGDVAYATLKEDGRSIRIGEGYPIEQHDGYSSPAFAIRTVKNAGVPYKFVVPTLAKR